MCHKNNTKSLFTDIDTLAGGIRSKTMVYLKKGYFKNAGKKLRNYKKAGKKLRNYKNAGKKLRNYKNAAKKLRNY